MKGGRYGVPWSFFIPHLSSFSSDSVWHGVFLDVEADLGFRRCRRRRKQRAEMLKDFAQGGVVEEQGPVNFGQAPEDGGVGGEVLAHFDKSADDVQAHGNRAGAVENRGGDQGAVFGEGERPIFQMLTSL